MGRRDLQLTENRDENSFNCPTYRLRKGEWPSSFWLPLRKSGEGVWWNRSWYLLPGNDLAVFLRALGEVFQGGKADTARLRKLDRCREGSASFWVTVHSEPQFLERTAPPLQCNSLKSPACLGTRHSDEASSAEGNRWQCDPWGRSHGHCDRRRVSENTNTINDIQTWIFLYFCGT
jgi:hypothetical protein